MQRGRITSFDLLAALFPVEPRVFSLLQRPIAGPCPTCPSGPPTFFLQNCFSASQAHAALPAAGTGGWGYSSPFLNREWMGLDCQGIRMNPRKIRVTNKYSEHQVSQIISVLFAHVFRRAEYTCQDEKYIYALLTISVLCFAALKPPFIIFCTARSGIKHICCNICRIQ